MLKKIVSLSLLAALLITGCSASTEVFNTYDVTLPVKIEADNTEGIYAQDCLSDGIAIIPPSKQSDADTALTAQSALLINDTTGKVVYSKNIYDKMYPASLTKIVTALVALKHSNLEDTVIISYNASHITEYGAKLCGFAEGDKIKLKELLYAFLIYSGNDAGIAIAEHVSGSLEVFANLMNKEMKTLGSVNSNFTNPHGLHDAEHYTCAYDLYLVFHELLKYDTFTDIINRAAYTINFRDASGNKKQLNFETTNKYLAGTASSPEGVSVIGGKTGTTIAAGSNLILYSKNADKDGYISLILHASDSYSLYNQMTYLLEME